MSKAGSRTTGFTIIELLVAVTIIGILASVAIPSFTRYQKKSRTVEMYEGLSKVATGAKLYYSKYAQLPATIPLTPLMTHAERCTAGHFFFPATTLQDFDTIGWTVLLFRPSDRTLYRYGFKNTSTAGPPAAISGVCEATGDLDCDGEMSRFEIRLERDGGIGGPLIQKGTFCVIGTETE